MDNLDVIVKIYNNIKLNNSDLLCAFGDSSLQDLVGCKIVNFKLKKEFEITGK